MYDIVWFDAAHATEAMSLLNLLPGGEDERLSRGKAHHFAMCRNAPACNVDGTIAHGKTYCVYTDRLGAETLSAGSTRDGRVLICDNCSKMEQVSDGIIGGYFKPEYWELPEVVKSANTRGTEEQKTVAIINENKERRNVERTRAIKRAQSGYWKTAARLCLPTGQLERVKCRASTDELKSIVVMGVMGGVRIPSEGEWMSFALRGIEPETQNDGPYDPTTFLAYCENQLSKAKKIGI